MWCDRPIHPLPTVSAVSPGPSLCSSSSCRPTLAGWRVALRELLGLLVLVGLSQADSVRAQPAEPSRSVPISVAHAASPITLDGRLDESVWDAATPLSLRQVRPVYLGSPSQPTRVLVASTRDALYVAAQLTHNSTGTIRSYSLYRDRYEGGDRFGILLDSFDDDESGVLFWTTPAGIRGDASIHNDGIDTPAGDAVNPNWNGHWSVETRTSGEGWVAEMRIPFSSLGYTSQGDRVQMGVIAFRDIAATGEQVAFPAVDPGYTLFSPSRAATLRLSQVRADRPVYVTPYLLGGTAVDGTASGSVRSRRVDAGLSAQFSIRNQFAVDLTANTDFAQVEADELRVNLTRFELFRPERRAFFQTRAGLFDFSLLGFGADRLFYSRRIGFSSGEAVGILGGARGVGRAGSWDIGAMSIQTQASANRPSENASVVRVRRPLYDAASTAGVLTTSRVARDGTQNVAIGADADLRLAGDDFLTLKVAHTNDTNQPSGGFSSGFAQIQVERRRRRGFNYWATASRYGPDFSPALGFTTREDVTEVGWWLLYDWVIGDGSPLAFVSPLQFLGYVTTRNADGSIESALFEYDTDWEWASGFEASTDLGWRIEDLREPLELTDAVQLPAKTYGFLTTSLGLDTPEGRRWVGELDLGYSTYYGGHRYTVELEPTLNVSRHLQLEGDYSYDRVRFPGRALAFDSHVGRLRVKTAVNRRLSLDALVQYASTDELLAGNVRLRYNAGEGRDVWLVFSERQTTRPLDLRPQTRDEGRSVRLKVTYTFAL